MPELSALADLIRTEWPDLAAVYLFGSQATGEANAESDLDLAVLAPLPFPAEQRWLLASKLAELAGRDVDLVDLRQASTVMRVQVLKSGQVLLDVHPLDRARFEMTALSAYARLNEERKDLLEDVRRRGSVYA